MNLWWLHLPYDRCTFTEISNRRCIAIGWQELGSISQLIDKRIEQERQFKGYIQVKGDMAYQGNSSWREKEREFHQVPQIFWQLLHIKKGDLIVSIESGNEQTFGRPTIRGISRASQDAINSYQFDPKYHHAHNVCQSTYWIPWDGFTMDAMDLPDKNFLTLVSDNHQIEKALNNWRHGVNVIQAAKKLAQASET